MFSQLLIAASAVLAALAIACVLSFQYDDPAQHYVDHMRCRLTTDRTAGPAAFQIRLPYTSGSDLRAVDRQLDCSADLVLSGPELATTALLIPAYAEAIELSVNGQHQVSGEIRSLRNVRYSTLPALFPLQKSARAGTNRIDLRVSAKFGRDVVLDRIRVGPYAQLRPIFSSRWLLAATLPTMASGATLALALVFGAIWYNRRKESAYGWLALLLLIEGLQGSVLIPDFLPPTDRAFWALTTLWASGANLLFVRRLFDLPNRRSERLIFVPPLVITLFMAIAPRAFVLLVVLPGSVGIFALYVIYAVVVLGRAGLRGNREAQFFLLVEVLVMGIALHDLLVSAHIIVQARFFSHSASSIFLLAPVMMMIRRKTQAMNELDQTAETLRLKVIEVERELRHTYETVREQREALLIGQERSRMMRDLHDGMSGDIVSMMALAERPDPDVAQIARHARNALADMRLIISSLEDYGGDLSLALGFWRERMEPQVRAAGIQLEWYIGDLPPQYWLSPSHVLDILRILQEAVTNAVRHSGASSIQVNCRIEAEAIHATISDDGDRNNGAEPSSGRGIANMKARAARLGARFDIAMSSAGTRVSLALPLQAAVASNLSAHAHG